MEYSLSGTEFINGKMFDSNGKLTHKTGNRFKLFPFVTHPNSVPVEDLSQLIGTYLCKIEDQKPVEITVADLVEKLKSETEIEAGQDALFYETVKQLFFDSEKQLRPLNLQMLSHISHKEVGEEKVADFLVDVLGEKENLKKLVSEAKQNEFNATNVFERLVLKYLLCDKEKKDDKIPYYRVVNAVTQQFESDLKYVLSNQNRVREYLISLLDLYFFSYTAQTSLQLERFMDGEREENIPLYFCLDWEKTSQSRQCYTYGWQKLQYAVKKMFAHAVTLEILNHTESGSDKIDYIALKKYISENPDHEKEIAQKIDEVTDLYRSSITDCSVMNEIKKTDDDDAVRASVRYLFDSVKCQFENTGRSKAYNSYAIKFELFCHKFLKSRGRSGRMLVLSEETLIFLTKISIKEHEQMRLKDVFDEFEKRGVFLDNISKEQVTIYFEKLNLIEKKSDNGDAKYVKRIL
ncbi:DNA phosphorothioation-dependent restriction protein DptG [Thomasclavelia cocleata]|uniref:DNA phosphorothioation-dependent restriction protein DptG n=2 Tax=Thomasclavelia cocleata TaxID=69824 RepID=UPI00255ABEC5|nr:DNA phosphorothioation-dependent restriction protein DptG [Thomasclavelia cocleata]